MSYALAMTAKVTEGNWTPLPGALPFAVHADIVYVIPTRTSAAPELASNGEIHFLDNVRYFPKAARAKDVPVEFSQPADQRKYLQEFSTDPETWSLGLAVLTLSSDWLIVAVSLFIDLRAKSQGWKSKEAFEHPLKVSVAETGTGRNYQVEGSGGDVLEALKVLQSPTPEIKNGGES